MDLFNAFRGLEEDIDEAAKSQLPRQAIVVRAERGGVWARYTPADTSVPPMWFPSVIANVAVGSTGWVTPLAGGKGLFLPSAAPQFPIIRSAGAWPSAITVASGQTQTIGDPAVISGLNPNQTYRVTVFGQVRGTCTTAAAGKFASTLTYRDGTLFLLNAGTDMEIGASRFYESSLSGEWYPTSAGEFIAYPAAAHEAGASFTVSPGYVTLIVSAPV